MKNKIIIAFILTFIFAAVAGSFVLAEDDEEEGQDRNTIVPISLPDTIRPAVSSQLTFSDSDNDGVIDALDKYPGEDDFAYGVTDNNKNGVVDSLEYLVAK